ncbi:macrophage mannose receptor 1-like [Xenia sp. Carnegie-2017]|uniref:macrophage mannose receptor 1-like n=1 Tax=Xenia sp. Carnegie-2017 TaxID=2897299 RepID=UPI001F048DAC|nr:macrophage mannose receptor 1-like [Xenia sp. Carnegie-2017]XP_046861771.1 macrophage mannose receptor 1-like [Xenia sp. Carnegie-2017]
MDIWSSCYFFSRTKKTWRKAKENCQKKGGFLAVPKNKAENDAICKFSQRRKLTYPFIGLFRNESDNKFYTLHNVKPTFINWGPEEPNNEGGNEDCVQYKNYYGRWNDEPCSRSHHFICQANNGSSCPRDWVKLRSSCYFFSETKKTWQKAKENCQKKGGFLAVPKNKAENDAIYKFSQRRKLTYPFIGLLRNESDNKFYTVHNVKPTFINWGPEEPNNEGGNKDCVQYKNYYGRWNDEPCSRSHHFICQRMRIKYINECLSDPCHVNANCTDTKESFECQCNEGYTGNGISCTNINECLNVPCDVNANCTDNEGSYECQCNDGYTGNGLSCTNLPTSPKSSSVESTIIGVAAGISAVVVFVIIIVVVAVACFLKSKKKKEQHQVVELETKIEHDNGDQIYDDVIGKIPPNFSEERCEIIHKQDVPLPKLPTQNEDDEGRSEHSPENLDYVAVIDQHYQPLILQKNAAPTEHADQQALPSTSFKKANNGTDLQEKLIITA